MNMEPKITIIKAYRGKETLRTLGQEVVAQMIRTGEYRQAVSAFREVFPLVTFGRKGRDGSVEGYDNMVKDLPRICFALEQEHRRGERVTLGYTGLVLLEVNNLTGQDEADAVRRGAAEMPQTLMAFIGADGQSVKIVCRGELLTPGGRRPSGGDEVLKGQNRSDGDEVLAGDRLSLTADQIPLFHENLYERARLIYNGQLGVTVEKLEPTPQRICYMSYDPGMVFNPSATPVYAKAEKPTQTLSRQPSTIEQTDGELGYDRYRSIHVAFEFNLTKAFDETEGIADKEERRHAMLVKLAQCCLKTGIPMAPAMRQALMHSLFWNDADLVKKVFENTYREDLVQKYTDRKGIRLEGAVPPETLLTMKINVFLSANYELRKNVMRGVAEYRMRTGIGFSFQDLTEEARNSITMRAMEQGIRCWDKDIRRYVNSDDIERYDPMNDYLEHLPRWDGRDRVEPLARRVPTAWTAWPHLFHIWMRSMVAMWLGKGQLTGNALVPLLIGRQGCGKSSFCRILLPRDLLDYYNDRINFKNEQDLNLGLTSFALINLDEFDKITQRQQIVLKYLVSTADLKYRPPYGKAYTSNRRYASFIGTTNDQMPLSDPSGSRRFVCVLVAGDIDFDTPVQHDQLYAQLMEEIRQGERYWLTKDEERNLMEHNLQYQRMNGLGEMLMAIIQRPRIPAPEGRQQDGGESEADGRWMTIPQLSALLKSHFTGYKEDPGTFQKIGTYLSRPEYRFQSKHVATGTIYWVRLKI